MLKRLTIFGFALAIALTSFAGDEAESGKILHETWEKIYPATGNLTLSVQNSDGRIYIYGSEANELNVSAIKRAFTKERLDAISVRVTLKGESASIETIVPSAPGGIMRDRSGTVDYTIIVPQTCSIAKAELANGEVIIQGLRGAFANARVGTGRLLARDCFSRTQVSVGRGGLDVFFAWWEEQPLALQAAIEDGDLRISFPKEAALQLEATASRGHISNRLREEGEPEGDLRNLSVTLGEGGPAEVKLQAETGNIRIEKSY